MSTFKDWLTKYWKWLTGGVVLISIYLIGLLKGNSRVKEEERKSDLLKEDSESIKKTKNEIIRSIESAAESNKEKERKLQKEKLSRIESAEKEAQKARKDLENNTDKLDKILQEKHGLTKI